VLVVILCSRFLVSLATVSWLAYERVFPGVDHSVVGDVRIKRNVRGGLLRTRDILVYLPPSYERVKTAHFPVLYMHDGQNCFDQKTSYSGEWGADETGEHLAKRGFECIIVAIPNAGEQRIDEYGPWFDPRVTLNGANGAGGQADVYLEFLLEVVKPLVDSSFRTIPDSRFTGLAGSSMGGLISLWCALEAPDVFGFAGCFSSAFWVGRRRIFDYVQRHIAPDLRVYLDCGFLEGGAMRESKLYLEDNRRMARLLESQGCYDLVYLEDETGRHAELEWRKRFPAALEWFLDPLTRPEVSSWSTPV
jgi:predicted alpha/beta superfamily hydrolase